MKNGRNKVLFAIITVCLTLLSVTACGETGTDMDVSEMTEEDDYALTGEHDEDSDWDTMSQSAKTLICLKNGDTKSLVGLSFGDEFDYDKYEII